MQVIGPWIFLLESWTFNTALNTNSKMSLVLYTGCTLPSAGILESYASSSLFPPL